MDSPLIFRIATVEDSSDLAKLINSAYRGEVSKKGWTTEADLLNGQRTDSAALAEMIQKPDQVFLIFENNQASLESATEQKKMMACVFLQKKEPKNSDGLEQKAYLGMLTVDPENQASGLGKQILATSEKWMQDTWQISKIEMTVISRRSELLAWYHRRGYLDTGVTKPFPYGDERFGIPKVNDLEFLVLEKSL